MQGNPKVINSIKGRSETVFDLGSSEYLYRRLVSFG